MVRVLSISRSSGSQLCLENDVWVIPSAEGAIRLDQPKHFMPLLPVLERPCQDFMRELADSLAALGLSHLADTFPLKELLSSALRSGAAYWIDLALNWLEEIPELHEPFLDSLAVIAREGGTQALRHKALKFQARIKRSRSSGNPA